MELAVTIKGGPGCQFLQPLVHRGLQLLGQHTRTLSFSRFINPRPMMCASTLPSVVALEWGVWS